MIKELIENEATVSLFTRPRRFGLKDIVLLIKGVSKSTNGLILSYISLEV